MAPKVRRWWRYIASTVICTRCASCAASRRFVRPQCREEADEVFRDLVQMPAGVPVTPTDVRVRFHRRAHLPILIASGILDKPVAMPWWQGATLRLTT